ncbi:MAG: helix-turn-helix domain-containing protein [Candidatus Schekmanbacteria bacterium]|nr:helix-turn-helix domain-containing protein [Candidatus Schekmanbacteria bacterium]
MEGKLLKAAEVAKMFQVQESTVYKWVHYGYIPYVKLGSALRFDKDSLLKWVKGKETKGKKQVFD